MSQASTQKRGRKYGSDYARAWSRSLHFGDVRTKPKLLSDIEIDRIRSEENKERPLYMMSDVVKVRKRRKGKTTQVYESKMSQLNPGDIVSARAGGWRGR